MSLFAALLAFASIAAPQPAESSPGLKLLVIELPDGVRGGVGRIKGKGAVPQGTDRLFFLHLLDIARQCGANFPMLSTNWSHSAHIVSWSTVRDREVVACLRSTMPTHFNAGLADPDARSGFTLPDSASFREFETVEARR